MSQNERKSKGSNLLMPLAIGGGLLLLFMGMRKAKAQDNTDIPMLPEPDSNQASTQISPEAAPKYTDLVDEEDSSESQAPVSSSQAYNTASSYSATPTNDANADDEQDDAEEDDSYSEPQPSRTAPKKPVQSKSTKMLTRSKPNPRVPTTINKANKMAPKIKFPNPATQKAKSLKMKGTQPKPAAQKPSSPIPIKMPIPFIAQAQKAAAAQAKTNANKKIFPLKQGQTNNYIKEVQRKIGVSQTGFFGTQTRAALLKRYKVSEVSEALYKQIISGKAPIIPLIPTAKRKVPVIKKPLNIRKK